MALLQNTEREDVEGLSKRLIKSDTLHDVFLSTLCRRVVVRWGKSGMGVERHGFCQPRGSAVQLQQLM